ncbi:MAG: hypothetical protein WD793_08735 [Steroidobacteraceae bacterium]
MENTGKTGISSQKSSRSIDRQLSVAPMMDWTDDRKIFLHINYLAFSQETRLLYVSSIEFPVVGHGQVCPDTAGRVGYGPYEYRSN